MTILNKRLSILILACLIAVLNIAIFADNWVDMGTYSDNGETLYWASQDLCESYNGYVFNNIGNAMTYTQAQMAIGQLDGNCKLPSYNEFKDLVNNCDVSFVTLNKIKRTGANGLPDWVLGQWLWNDAIMADGQIANMHIQIKIEPSLASITTSNGYQWEGAYTYMNGKLYIGKLVLNLRFDLEKLVDNRGYVYNRVMRARDIVICAVKLTSKINGNSIFLAYNNDIAVSASSLLRQIWLQRSNNQQKDSFHFGFFTKDDAGIYDIDNLDGPKEVFQVRPVKCVSLDGNKKMEIDKLKAEVSLMQEELRDLSTFNRQVLMFFEGDRGLNMPNEPIVFTPRSSKPRDLQICYNELNNSLKEERKLYQKVTNDRFMQNDYSMIFDPLFNIEQLAEMIDISAVAKAKNGETTLQVSVNASDNGKKYGKELLKFLKKNKFTSLVELPRLWYLHYEFNISVLLSKILIRDSEGNKYQLKSLKSLISENGIFSADLVKNGQKIGDVRVIRNQKNNNYVHYIYNGTTRYQILNLPFINLDNPLYYVDIFLPDDQYSFDRDGDDSMYHSEIIKNGKIKNIQFVSNRENLKEFRITNEKGFFRQLADEFTHDLKNIGSSSRQSGSQSGRRSADSLLEQIINRSNRSNRSNSGGSDSQKASQEKEQEKRN